MACNKKDFNNNGDVPRITSINASTVNEVIVVENGIAKAITVANFFESFSSQLPTAMNDGDANVPSGSFYVIASGSPSQVEGTVMRKI